MSPGEVVVEGVMVEEPAAVGAKTAGEVFGFSEQTVSVPPGDVGLTFDDRDWRRPLIVKWVAAGSPLFGRVQAGATLVAVDGVRATSSNIRDAISWDGRVIKPGLLDDDGAKTLIFQTGMDLGFTYVGRDRTVRDEGVVYVGREDIEGPLMSADAVVDVFAMDRGRFDAANAAKARTRADRALVFTDKGVVGRRHHQGGRVNAITWGGFRIEDVRIRTFDVGFLGACCRAFCRPEAPGLYRATISSIHHKGEGPRDDGGPMATIEVLALARSPDDLRSSLRAAKEKYGAPNAAEMAR